MRTHGSLTGHIEYDCPFCQAPHVTFVTGEDIDIFKKVIYTDATEHPVNSFYAEYVTSCLKCNKRIEVDI